MGQSSEKALNKEADKKEEISINTNEEKDDFCQKSSQQPVQRMFQIWQKEFPDSDEVLTKQVSAWLKAAFDEKFAKNFYEWSCYLRKVKTSSFIMECPHLQRLSWVLSFDTITKTQQKGYNVSEPDPDPKELKRYEKELLAKLSQEIEVLFEDPICKKQRHKILEMIGVFDYKAWFSKVSMELCGENFKCYGSPLVESLIQDKVSHLLFYHGYERPDRTELSSFGDISGMLMKKIFSKPLENFQ